MNGGIMKPPVVVLGYSRANTLVLSLGSLSRCYDFEGRDIFLFLDAPYKEEHRSDTDKVYETALRLKKDFLPQLKIIKRERNYGVPGNLLSAVTEVVNKYGSVIFFEDDVLVSRTFLRYMDGALSAYRTDKRIWGVNGYQSPYLRVPKKYSHDVYLNPRHYPWGFGTWADRWNAVDFDLKNWPEERDNPFVRALIDVQGGDMWGMIDGQYRGLITTWDVQCSCYMAKSQMYSIEPRYSLTKNIGFMSPIAVHCKGRNLAIQNQYYYNFEPKKYPVGLKPDSDLLRLFRHQWIDPSFRGRVIRKMIRIMALFRRHTNEPCEILSNY